MEKLVDEAAGERFNGGKLLGGECADAGVDAAQFCLADFLGLALEGDDGRRDVDGALALVKALDLSGNEGLGVSGLAAALGEVRGGDGLQVVDVVDEDAVELVDGGIDVAGHGNVNEEHGPITAAVHELLAVLAAEDGMGRTGRADDDVSLGGGFIELIEGDDSAIEGFGELASALECAVGNEDGAGSLLDKMAGGKLAHFTGANEKDGAALKGAEDLAGQLDGNGGDGDGVGADLRL